MNKDDDADVKPNKQEVLASIRSDSSTETGSGTERRGFLRDTVSFVGSSVATLFGFSSRSTAMSPREERVAKAAAETYTSSETIRGVIQSHAFDLLQYLAREGALKHGAVSTLPVEKVYTSIRSYVDADEGVIVHATAPDGQPNVKIQVKKDLPDGRKLVLVVNPKTGKSHARFESEDAKRAIAAPVSDQTETHFAASSSEDATAQSCDRECESPDYRCGYSCTYNSCGCVEYKVYDSCTDPDCIGCSIYSYSCCGQYSCD
jgi:hypothetical protein